MPQSVLALELVGLASKVLVSTRASAAIACAVGGFSSQLVFRNADKSKDGVPDRSGFGLQMNVECNWRAMAGTQYSVSRCEGIVEISPVLVACTSLSHRYPRSEGWERKEDLKGCGLKRPPKNGASRSTPIGFIP